MTERTYNKITDAVCASLFAFMWLFAGCLAIAGIMLHIPYLPYAFALCFFAMTAFALNWVMSDE